MSNVTDFVKNAALQQQNKTSHVVAWHGLRYVQEETDGNSSWAVQTVCPWKLWQSYCGIWWI